MGWRFCTDVLTHCLIFKTPVIYLNASDNSNRQITLTNGAWRDAGPVQALQALANNARLSTSAEIVPSLQLKNSSQPSPSYLSSAVTY